MENKLFVKKSININAPITKVWDALINPETTKKYMFGCEAISDWMVGSPLIWKGCGVDEDKVFIKRQAINIIPEKLLEYTVFALDEGLDDIPTNYTTVKYELSSNNHHTILNTLQGDFSKVSDGERRYDDTIKGWDYVLGQLKKAIEL